MLNKKLRIPFKEPLLLSVDEKQIIVKCLEWFLNEDKANKLDRWLGRNGPYNHLEPRLRTRCHVGIILNYVIKNYDHFDINFSINKLKEIKDNNHILIVNDLSRKPLKFRDQLGFDYGNGVIGFAWCLEYFLSEKFLNYKNVEKSLEYNLLKESFLWNKDLGKFMLQDHDKSTHRSYDPTFNHQLWAISTYLYFQKDSSIQTTVDIFLKKNKTQIYFDGILYHKSKNQFTKNFSNKIRMLKYYPKSVSYQSFNVIALRRFREYITKSNDPNGDIKRVLNTNLKLYHIPIVILERHGFRYNPSGFEIAIDNNSFTNKILNFLQCKIISYAINNSFSDKLFDRNRLISRSYEVLLN